jgi:hypothetical protein
VDWQEPVGSILKLFLDLSFSVLYADLDAFNQRISNVFFNNQKL